ncbi:hypothetical protein [Streptomyces daliensis]
MIRCALWLVTEVGEGKIFTKTQLREAFPEVAQIDRRMRDLRSHGWEIHTSREDPALKQEEQRYVKKGLEVWLPGQAKPKPKASLTATQRSSTFRTDGHLCRSCGVSAGEPYGDGGSDAQLDIARRPVKMADGTVEIQLVTECNRCRVGRRGDVEDLGELLEAVRALTSLERKVLGGWIKSGRRTQSPLEKLWGTYRSLPEESRTAFAEEVAREQKAEDAE